jgi:AraC-like DNA-binding protein
MAFLEQVPPPDLARYVDAFWTCSRPGGAATILPDGCVEAVLAVEGRFRLAGADRGRGTGLCLVGLATRPLPARYEGEARLAGVRLTPVGALRLLGDGLRPLANGAADAGDVLPCAPRLADAAESLARTGSAEELARALRSAVHARPCPQPRLERALELLRAGCASIDAVARQVGVSTRHLDRWFERSVGIPPKLLARTVRFRKAVDMGVPGLATWAQVAARCGYADQAHLSREFAEFCGRAPKRLRSARSRPG